MREKLNELEGLEDDKANILEFPPIFGGVDAFDSDAYEADAYEASSSNLIALIIV